MRTAPRLLPALLALVLLAAACSSAKKSDPAAGDKVDAGSTGTTGLPGASASEVTSPPDGTPAAPGPAGSPKPGAAPKPGSAANAPAPVAPSAPGTKPDPNLFAGAANTRGITDTQIVICWHSALTYGPAFNASPDDFNVYYNAINDAGGIFGRKITSTYENDNYDPATAVQAAETCKSKNPMMILGGIGFDQIPAVRNWAETNKELYLHHIATEKGTAGKLYSYTTQPTVERAGEAFAQLAAARFKTKKIGVLYRNSEFWAPGFEAFKAVGKRLGLTIVLSVPVEKNQANYTQALISLRDAGAEVVFGWENTLALTQMVKQAKAQNYSPQWLAFPFNLTAQTLGDDAMTPPMVGLASWPGYSKGDYTGTFASYANDMKEFEAQYAKYRPNTDIGGVAGDLLWLKWVEDKRLVELLKACGRTCTRNHLVGLLVNGYRATTSPTCPLDFGNNRHDGSGGLLSVMETYRAPGGKVNWRSTALCRSNKF